MGPGHGVGGPVAGPGLDVHGPVYVRDGPGSVYDTREQFLLIWDDKIVFVDKNQANIFLPSSAPTATKLG